MGILGFEVREQWASKPGGGSSQVAGLANLALGDGAVIEMFSIQSDEVDPTYNGPPFRPGLRNMCIEAEDFDAAVE